ncbi:MAG TPA: sigma-70 family RNA polymerase sigma factor [Acidimicrobiales bacterium]|nr:sigma-70 family RNA polymerase sigma factor [Acidimicrobiales bacterium]
MAYPCSWLGGGQRGSSHSTGRDAGPMTSTRPDDPPSDVAALEPVIRRVVAARVPDPHLVDDLVQESPTRVLESRRSLEGGALLAYAIVSAQNLVISEGRTEHRRERLGPRLADLSQPQRPDDAVVADEERRAVRSALRQLSREERSFLLAHEVEGKDNVSLARELHASPGAISLRLFRARAKLRVEYVLALCRVQPPTAACRPVLLALSAADRRRQQHLDAGGHLLSCTSCAGLSQDLIERHRPLPAVWPLLPVAGATRWARRRLRHRPVRAATVGVTAGAALAVILVAGSEEPAACGGSLTVDGERIALSDPAQLAEMAGRPVAGRALPVESIPANEGFWLGCAEGHVWVELRGTGESPGRVTPGQRLDFSGTVARHSDGYSGDVGVEVAEGAAELDGHGVHLEVRYSEVQPHS